MIDILANVGKKFRLRKALPGIYRGSKLAEGTLLELTEVQLESTSAVIIFKISKSNDLAKIEKELLDKYTGDAERDLAKRKTQYAKIIKIWEETPEIFKVQERNYYKEDKIYDCTVPELMGKNYMNGFVTGCGGNTYYSKEWFQNHLDNWDKLVDEEMKSTKRLVKHMMRDLVKEDIEIKYSKLDEVIELDEKAKVTRKPKINFTIDGDTLNSILCEFDSDGFDIDEEFIKFLIDEGEDEETIKMFKEVLGGTIIADTEGYHHNDGQICDYTVTLSTKEGYEYYAYNSHCLITGWNFHGQVKFN